MSVRSHHPLTIGETYLFELWQEGNSLVVEGVVRWSRSRDLVPAAGSSEASRFQAGVAFERVRSRERRYPWPTEVEAPPADGRPVDRLVAARSALQEADNVHSAAENLLDILAPVFERLVLLRYHPDAVRAWMGRGRTLRPRRLQSLELSLSEPSLFLHMREGGSYFRGIQPPMPVHRQLVSCWNGSFEQDCVLLPMRIAGRAVTVLYADKGLAELTDQDLELLLRAGRLLEETMSTLIRRRKAATQILGDSLAPA